MFKQGIHKQSIGGIHDKIARVMFQYWITPHSTTGMYVSGRNVIGQKYTLLFTSVEARYWTESYRRATKAEILTRFLLS